MTTRGGTGLEPGTWAGEAVVTACVVVALLPVGYLHIEGFGAADPVDGVISDHGSLPGGDALLGVAALSLAVACTVLGPALRQAGLPGSRWPVVLLRSVAPALVLVAVFPTHPSGLPAGPASQVHRAAGGRVFAMLPPAAWMVARRARPAPAWQPAVPALGRIAGVTGVLSAGFLLTHVAIVIAGSPGLPLIGGAQRVLCAAVMLILVATARATRLAAERALEPALEPGGDLSGPAPHPRLRGAA